MDDKEQKFKTYRSLSNMHNFRLRLFAEGILTGILAGIVISFFRFALSEMEYLRGALYNRLWVSDWSINACWFAVLIAIAFILHKLNCIKPVPTLAWPSPTSCRSSASPGLWGLR